MRSLALLPLLCLAAAGPAPVSEDEFSWDFEGDQVNAPPAGFTFGRTGGGRPGKWVVRTDVTGPAGGHVLVQADADRSADRFLVAAADQPRLENVRADVRCKAVSGKVDRACGLVVRYRDQNNYYLARANALEDNVRLYRVVNGRRTQLASWSGKVAPDVWHVLSFDARGDHLQVFFDRRRVIDARDGTLRGAGRIGLWTKADSVTSFDDLSAQEVEAPWPEPPAAARPGGPAPQARSPGAAR